MQSTIRIGQIGSAYNTGISHISWGFAEHLNAKTLLYDYKPLTMFPERFPNSKITKEIVQADIDWLLSDIDVLITVETPYFWDVYRQARAKGIKTVLMPMYEWLDRSRTELQYVDLFICPSESTYHSMWGNKIQVPTEIPVDLTKFTPQIVKKAKVFLHNSGHGGLYGRNSTLELLQAIPMVKSNVRFIINSQYKLDRIDDSRITYTEANIKNYWNLYNGEDVWILPGKYGVAYVGIQEAMASGMPIMFTDMYPFNSYLPKELLIKPASINTIKIYANQAEQSAVHDPAIIAAKIDEVAQMDLTKYSERSLELAKEWSWDVWKDKYIKIFEEL